MSDLVPFTAAVMTHDHAKLRTLLDAATPDELNTGDAQSSLRLLCRQPDCLHLVKDYIKKGSDVNYSDCSSSGSTPLAAACFGGCLDTARFLLERGADPNDEDDAGKTAFSFATTDACRAVLLEHGAQQLEQDMESLKKETMALRTIPSKGVMTATEAIDTAMQKKKWEKVRESLSESQQEQLDVHKSKGVASAVSGDIEGALEEFQMGLKIFQTEGLLMNSFRALMELGRFYEAEQMARDQVILFGTANALTNLGYAYEMQDRLNEASQCYEQALVVDDSYDLAIRGMEEVRFKQILELPNVSVLKLGGDEEGSDSEGSDSQGSDSEGSDSQECDADSEESDRD